MCKIRNKGRIKPLKYEIPNRNEKARPPTTPKYNKIKIGINSILFCLLKNAKDNFKESVSITR